jgi:hypothetical protein
MVATTGLALGLSPAAASAAGFSAVGPSAASGIWEKAKTRSMGCFLCRQNRGFLVGGLGHLDYFSIQLGME